MPHLVVENGPLAGERLEVKETLTVGRVEGDVVIADAKLSRRHAVFRATGQGLEVEDLGSTNGTFIEGRRIDASTPVRDGEHVHMGGSSFAVELERVIEPTRVDKTVIAEVDDASLQPSGAVGPDARSEPPMTAAPPEPPVKPAPPEPPMTAAPPEPPVKPAPPEPPITAGPPEPPATEAPPDDPVIPAPVEGPVTRAPSEMPEPVPPVPAAPPLTPEPAPPAAPVPPPAITPSPAQLGAFSPGASRRGGLATRSWIPVALSFGTVILVAIALVIYFAAR